MTVVMGCLLFLRSHTISWLVPPGAPHFLSSARLSKQHLPRGLQHNNWCNARSLHRFHRASTMSLCGVSWGRAALPHSCGRLAQAPVAVVGGGWWGRVREGPLGAEGQLGGVGGQGGCWWTSPQAFRLPLGQHSRSILLQRLALPVCYLYCSCCPGVFFKANW